MDSHTLERLEFTRIREMVAEHACSPLGRKMVMKIKPVNRQDLIQLWHRQVIEMNSLVENTGLPPFGGLHDVREMVRRAVPPAKLEPEEFSELADSLSAASSIYAWSRKLPETCPELRSLTASLGDFQPIVDQIRNVIDPRGRILDHATPRLSRIRSAIIDAQTQVRAVFERLLRSPLVTKWLRYSEATFHDDRLVLPLGAEHRGRVPGIIHRTSGSGATLFVEPEEAVQLNNTIISLRQDETEEIGRILWHLTHLVHANAEPVIRSLDILAILDLIATKTRFAKAYCLTCPNTGEGRILRLRTAFHPILMWLRKKQQLAGQQTHPVVPIDLRLGEDFDLLVVTGPNTGGKTVTIKTIGLLACMSQAGLPIPADEGASLPVYRNIWIDVGDEQSLQQSLSTFSAHMTQLLRMLQRADKDTLVLIDEMGAGTDPDEGAAIGRAVVEELLRIGCHAIVTTHLSVLKSIAFMHPRADNAAVEFDIETLQPTYRLILGEPGNSNALAIAERLGMPKSIVQSACRYLSEQGRVLQKAIDGTLDVRRKAEQARMDAEISHRQTEQARKEFEIQKQELLRRQTEFETWTKAMAELRPGHTVHVRRFDREGTIVRMQLQKQTAVVSLGTLELEVPLSDLRIPPPTEKS